MALALALPLAAQADDKAKVMDEWRPISTLWSTGGIIFPEQIPRDEYPKMLLIDARDSASQGLMYA